MDGPPAPADPGPKQADGHAVLVVAAVVAVTPLALALADREATLLGVPLLAVYIFAVWCVGVGVTAWLSHGPGGRRP